MIRTAGPNEVPVLVLSHTPVDPSISNSSCSSHRDGDSVNGHLDLGNLPAELRVLVVEIKRRELHKVAELLAPHVRRRVKNYLEPSVNWHDLNPADTAGLGITRRAEELLDSVAAAQGPENEGLLQEAHLDNLAPRTVAPRPCARDRGGTPPNGITRE